MPKLARSPAHASIIIDRTVGGYRAGPCSGDDTRPTGGSSRSIAVIAVIYLFLPNTGLLSRNTRSSLIWEKEEKVTTMTTIATIFDGPRGHLRLTFSAIVSSVVVAFPTSKRAALRVVPFSPRGAAA